MGGGVCGLATGLMLARDGPEGHRPRARPRAGARDPGGRLGLVGAGGVSQFRQAHHLHPGGRVVLDEELPDVRDALVDAGATTERSTSLELLAA